MPVLGTRGGGSNRGFGFGGLSAPNPVTSTLGVGSNEFVFEQSNGDLEVRWVDPIFTGSLPLLDINVDLLDGDTVFQTDIIAPGVGVTNFSGLEIGTTYTVNIRARNAVGFSIPATDAGVSSVPPQSPIIDTCTNGRNKTLVVNWTNPNDTGGIPLNRFQIQWIDQVSLVEETQVFNLSPTGTFSVTAAEYNRDYRIRVSVGNDRGFSPYSALSNTVNTVTSAPTAPTIGTAIRGNQQVTVNFTAPADDGNADIIGYIAESSPGSIQGFGAGDAQSIVVTGLTNGTSYTFRVQAQNGFEVGTASAASNAVIPATVPDAPIIGTAVFVNSTTADVSYTAPASNGGVPILSYTAVSTPGEFTQTRISATSGTIRVTGLTSGAYYTFVVFATNEVGNSANSDSSNSVPIGGVPSTPSIRARYMRDNTAGIAVNVGTDASRGGWPVSECTYTVQNTLNNGTASGNTLAAGSTDVVYIRVTTGIVNGASYAFRVRVTNPNGTSSYSLVDGAATVCYAHGENNYTSPGTFNWTAPVGVSRVSVVCIGGGGNANFTGSTNFGGGGGGGLGYIDNYSVSEGSTYSVVVGAGGAGGGAGTISDGTDSYFVDTSTVRGIGGTSGVNFPGKGGGFVGNGGGFGGNGGITGWSSSPGGGAGGYSGKGGNGLIQSEGLDTVIQTGGLGGGGAGGKNSEQQGGGVGLRGRGISGYKGHTTADGGESGSTGLGQISAYGGGGAGWGSGQSGAVRIIWPGQIRRFASGAVTQNLSSTPGAPPTSPRLDLYDYQQVDTTTVDIRYELPPQSGYYPIYEIVVTLTATGVPTLEGSLSNLTNIPHWGQVRVSNLIPNQTYQARAKARSVEGFSALSNTINVTVGAIGEQIFSNSGTFTFVVPPTVNSVDVVCVGAGGAGDTNTGGGGGAYAYVNNLTVIPWNRETVVVGSTGRRNTSGTESYFRNPDTVKASGGSAGVEPIGGAGGNSIVGSGGFGGNGFNGGGGAGGPSGNGGNGINGSTPPTAGRGGGGAGGFAGGSSDRILAGGVGLYGRGPSGGRFNTSLGLDFGAGESGSVTTGSSSYGAGASGWDPAVGGAVRISWNRGILFSQDFPSNNTGRYVRDAVPGTPKIGKPYAVNSTTVALPYGIPDVIGGAGITAYKFRAYNNTTATETIISEPATSSTKDGIYNFSSLTANNSYTFEVLAVNSFGDGPYISYGETIVPGRVGQVEFTNSGTYNWTVPNGVFSVSVVCVGAGGAGDTNTGGGGGGLGYINNLSVVQYTTETVVVGSTGRRNTSGTESYFRNPDTVRGDGGTAGDSGIGGTGGNFLPQGGTGGNGRQGGGGAGGYAGSGGIGIDGLNAGTNGSGGGGAGGLSGGSSSRILAGGVGILGQGNNGQYPGGNGSTDTGSAAYGAGVSGWDSAVRGAVRIIYPGNTRSFPSTLTENR